MALRPHSLRRLLVRRSLASRPAATITKISAHSASARSFSVSGADSTKNQIYDTVRRPADFHTYQLLTTSARVPLITLWTTNWCPTCRIVSPILESLVESGVGEAEGGVALCTIEYDSPDIMREGFGHAYVISSVPTIMAFDEQGPRMSTRLMDPAEMTNDEFLERWIRNEARRMGGGPLGGWFRT